MTSDLSGDRKGGSSPSSERRPGNDGGSGQVWPVESGPSTGHTPIGPHPLAGRTVNRRTLPKSRLPSPST